MLCCAVLYSVVLNCYILYCKARYCTVCGIQVYPTSMRTTGLGAASSFSRLGGVACPYVAVNLIRSCNQGTAFALFGVVPLLASFAALAFTVETSKKELCEDVEVPPSNGR